MTTPTCDVTAPLLGPPGSEAEFWALRLREALDECREVLQTAGSCYEPAAGWDLLLNLPEL
jgi:hypothetical protein